MTPTDPLRTRGFVVDEDGRAWNGDTELELRPKSRLLLHFLLTHSGIHDKETLINAVWGHTHVEDQALFQLISDIRQKFADRNCIATFPGRGYRWAWPVENDRPAPSRRWLVGGFLLTAVMLVGVWWLSRDEVAPSPQYFTPALVALSQAIEARAEGDLQRSIELLELAITENPTFAMAKMELAQTLIEQGRLDEATQVAHEALSDTRITNDRYLEVSANVLLSRIHWLKGDLGIAQSFSSAAGDLARDNGFVCAAQLTEDWSRQLGAAMLGVPSDAMVEFSLATLASCRAQLDEDLETRWSKG